MNEQLFFDLGQQRHAADVKRAEANYARQTATKAAGSGPRARLAISLVNLATRLQPSLAITVQRPAQPAAV